MAGADRRRVSQIEAVPRYRCGRKLQRVPRGPAVLIAHSTRRGRLAYRTLSCSLAILAGCGVARAAHADDSRTLRAELASADTVIAVEAGEHAPRLITLKSGGATAWTNRADET